jgi:hypothetical protein
MLRRVALALTLASAPLVTAGCGDASFHVDRAAEFPKAAGASISIFGVYRDGRLAPEAWDSFRSHLTPLFGAAGCEPGYPDVFAASGTPVVQAVDDFTRANGVTDELLDRVASTAKGDLVLLIALTGRPGVKADTEASPTRAAAPSMRAGGRRGTPSSGSTHRAADAPAFEAVGIVFSPKAHRSVGAIRLSYTGASLDEALESFMAHLGAEMPKASCAGWKGDLHLEVGDVRRLESQ